MIFREMRIPTAIPFLPAEVAGCHRGVIRTVHLCKERKTFRYTIYTVAMRFGVVIF